MTDEEKVIDGKRLTAAYAPFKSFITSLDYLKQAIPDHLDISAWPTFSGGLRGQLIAAYRFLGLIDTNNAVLPLLHQLVDEATRKQALSSAIRSAYPVLFKLDLSRATPNQFAEILRTEYNVSGSTFDKAQTFFLQAAKFSGLSLSPAISRKTRNSPKKRKATFNGAPAGAREEAPSQDQPEIPHPHRSRGTSKTIKLRGGGTATISFDVDIITMTDEDQKFVFDMIRHMREYDEKAPKASA